MNLDVKNWKDFLLFDYFDIVSGKYHYPEEYEEGSTPYYSASNENNGISLYIDLKPDFDGNCVVTGKVGCTAFYVPESFCATSDVNIFKPRFNMSPEVGLFIANIINFNENYKWAYGRQCRVGNSKKIVIKLPVNSQGNPDWQFMEDYIKSLHYKPLTTKNKSGQASDLNVQSWEYVLLKDICKITMGNKMDASAMSSNEPKVNFVGRSADNNGVAGKVDIVYDDKGNKIEPYPAGCITVALGGSLGSTYLQNEPFYTSQNVSVLEFPKEVSDCAKLFLCTLIYNESKYKYFPFGRELNTHIRTDYGFTIPVTSEGEPDWGFMENYIKSLPYGDRL